MTTRPGGRRLLLTMSPEERATMHAHRGQPGRVTVTEERKLAATQRAVHRALTRNATREAHAVEAQQIREAAAQTYGPHGKSPRVKK